MCVCASNRRITLNSKNKTDIIFQQSPVGYKTRTTGELRYLYATLLAAVIIMCTTHLLRPLQYTYFMYIIYFSSDLPFYCFYFGGIILFSPRSTSKSCRFKRFRIRTYIYVYNIRVPETEKRKHLK